MLPLQVYEQFTRAMAQCGLTSGDIITLAVFDDSEKGARFLLQNRVNIRDHSFVRDQEGKIIKLDQPAK